MFPRTRITTYTIIWTTMKNTRISVILLSELEQGILIHFPQLLAVQPLLLSVGIFLVVPLLARPRHDDTLFHLGAPIRERLFDAVPDVEQQPLAVLGDVKMDLHQAHRGDVDAVVLAQHVGVDVLLQRARQRSFR